MARKKVVPTPEEVMEEEGLITAPEPGVKDPGARTSVGPRWIKRVRLPNGKVYRLAKPVYLDPTAMEEITAVGDDGNSYMISFVAAKMRGWAV